MVKERQEKKKTGMDFCNKIFYLHPTIPHDVIPSGLSSLVFTSQLMQTKQDTRRQNSREDKTDQFTMQRAEINPFPLISAQDDVHQDTSEDCPVANREATKTMANENRVEGRWYTISCLKLLLVMPVHDVHFLCFGIFFPRLIFCMANTNMVSRP
jgi:hypothetical protein